MKYENYNFFFKQPSIFLVPYLNPCENREIWWFSLNFGGIMAIENLTFSTFSFLFLFLATYSQKKGRWGGGVFLEHVSKLPQKKIKEKINK
jgi:hypothetical protein